MEISKQNIQKFKKKKIPKCKVAALITATLTGEHGGILKLLKIL